jgi:hypothetical protein
LRLAPALDLDVSQRDQLTGQPAAHVSGQRPMLGREREGRDGQDQAESQCPDRHLDTDDRSSD